jgi:hypothetical protein
MSQTKRVVGAATLMVVAANVVAINAVGLAAASAGPTLVPLVSTFRNCSFQETRWVSPTGYGSGDARIGADGANQVTADVRLATAAPNTRYTVRLIQVPRAAHRTCTAGDPGVAVADLFTDGAGSAAVRMRAAKMAGATNAWVSIDGPPPPGQVIGEFYTSEELASLA